MSFINENNEHSVHSANIDVGDSMYTEFNASLYMYLIKVHQAIWIATHGRTYGVDELPAEIL